MILLIARLASATDLSMGCPTLLDTVDAHTLHASPATVPFTFADVLALVGTQTEGATCDAAGCTWADGSLWTADSASIVVRYVGAEAERWRYTTLDAAQSDATGSAWSVTWSGAPFAGLPADSGMGSVAWSERFYEDVWHAYTGDLNWVGDCWVSVVADVVEGAPAENGYTFTVGSHQVEVLEDLGFCAEGGARVLGSYDGGATVSLSDADWSPSAEPDADGDGWSVRCGDCDDADAAVHPDVMRAEWYGADVDCDGVRADDDCDDDDPGAYPGADEIPADGIDQDCSGHDYVDADGDGYDLWGGDCDDADPALHPGADEVPDDGIDQDCTGHDFVDADGDGWDAWANDCDDADPATHPTAVEIPCDGIDQDCLRGDLCDEPADTAASVDTGPEDSGASADSPGCGCGPDGAAPSGWALVALAAAARRPRRSLGAPTG